MFCVLFLDCSSKHSMSSISWGLNMKSISLAQQREGSGLLSSFWPVSSVLPNMDHASVGALSLVPSTRHGTQSWDGETEASGGSPSLQMSSVGQVW